MSTEPSREDNGIPRGALIVVVAGLLACLAAAALATDKSDGEAANLEWVKRVAMPDSQPVDVPGGRGKTMQLVDAQIVATGTNVSGYSLFRVAADLRIAAGSPVGDGIVLCKIEGGDRAEIARTSGGLRALYPRSSESGSTARTCPKCC